MLDEIFEDVNMPMFMGTYIVAVILVLMMFNNLKGTSGEMNPIMLIIILVLLLPIALLVTKWKSD
jgi:hypothetical protein